MSFITESFNKTVSISRVTGRTAYGEIESVQPSQPCYFEQGFNKVVSSQGHEVVSSAFAIFDIAVNIAINDKLTIDGVKYEIITIHKIPDLEDNAYSHQEIYLKETI